MVRFEDVVDGDVLFLLDLGRIAPDALAERMLTMRNDGFDEGVVTGFHAIFD